MVCAHSLAVGLAFLRAKQGSISGDGERRVETGMVKATGPVFSLIDGTQAVLHVVIAPSFTSGWEKDSVVICVEIETGGRTILAHALDARGTYRVGAQDLRVLEVILQVNNGELPGMMTLDRQKCRVVLEALRGHPQVTLGRGKGVETGELLAQVAGGGVEQKPFRQAQGPERAEGEAKVAKGDGRGEYLLRLEGSLNHLSARLQVRASPLGPFGPLRPSAAPDRTALDRLHAAGFAEPDAKGEMALKGERAILRFLGGALPALEREWTVELGAALL